MLSFIFLKHANKKLSATVSAVHPPHFFHSPRQTTAKKIYFHCCCVLSLILMNLYLFCSLITTAVILSFNNPENLFNDDQGLSVFCVFVPKECGRMGMKIKLQFKHSPNQ
jgi:hypothetical protein